jgi:hypothetical protein
VLRRVAAAEFLAEGQALELPAGDRRAPRVGHNGGRPRRVRCVGRDAAVLAPWSPRERVVHSGHSYSVPSRGARAGSGGNGAGWRSCQAACRPAALQNTRRPDGRNRRPHTPQAIVTPSLRNGGSGMARLLSTPNPPQRLWVKPRRIESPVRFSGRAGDPQAEELSWPPLGDFVAISGELRDRLRGESHDR